MTPTSNRFVFFESLNFGWFILAVWFYILLVDVLHIFTWRYVEKRICRDMVGDLHREYAFANPDKQDGRLAGFKLDPFLSLELEKVGNSVVHRAHIHHNILVVLVPVFLVPICIAGIVYFSDHRSVTVPLTGGLAIFLEIKMVWSQLEALMEEE